MGCFVSSCIWVDRSVEPSRRSLGRHSKTHRFDVVKVFADDLEPPKNNCLHLENSKLCIYKLATSRNYRRVCLHRHFLKAHVCFILPESPD